MKIPRMPTGHTLHVMDRDWAKSTKRKNPDRMTQTPIGYHHARRGVGGYTWGRRGGPGGANLVGGGGAEGTLGFGIAVRSAPHFSQYFASSSFRAPQRLQYIVNHRRLMLPVVDRKVAWNFMDADVYVVWSGA